MILYRKYQSGTKLDSIYTKYPALRNMGDVVLKADTAFTRDKTGIGDIEYFSPDSSRTQITYPTGYVYPHPKVGSHGIVYNPKNNNNESITLDMLHGMVQDPNYNVIREEYKTQALKDREGDIKHWYTQDKANGRAQDGYEQWVNNYVDGLIRSEVSSATTGEYSIERQGNSQAMKAISDRLKKYLKTGVK